MCVAGIFENCTFEGLIGGGGSHGPVTSVAQAVTRLQILACHGTPRPTPPLLGFPPRRRLAHLRFFGERRKEILLPISRDYFFLSLADVMFYKKCKWPLYATAVKPFEKGLQ